MTSSMVARCPLNGVEKHDTTPPTLIAVDADLPHSSTHAFRSCSSTGKAGFVSCKKKNRNAKNMASAVARAYMGVWGRCPWSGGQRGEASG